ncbi:MAG: penicillin-binding transpeptidase domain-containing protein, partial [Proteobacteria bacterium]|nr:penicillin-binding transpeptidase domain-containing protein [Pseudomonadota bacterium]
KNIISKSIGLLALTFSSNQLGLSSALNQKIEDARIQLDTDFDIVFQNMNAMIPDKNGQLHKTTIDPDLQLKLQAFITERGSPISAIVISDVVTGKILAMAQGRKSEHWGGSTHTALHNKFPAASLFKTIVAAAAMEVTPTGVDQSFGLQGGCGGQDILPKGDWINDDRGSQMTLRRAFGHSCNSFFAKLAINQLGLGTITSYAKFFGWEHNLPADFMVEPSKMLAPGAAQSTTHTVGRFAAGFGHVTISPVHANWIALAIANKGIPKPLRLFEPETKASVDVANPQNSANLDHLDINQLISTNDNVDAIEKVSNGAESSAIISANTASKLLDMFRSTVDDGTASNVFNRGYYRSIAQETGGKTGTLNGRTPQGLTTLFFGVYPISRPQIAVSTVVVLENRFYFKAAQLAAEGIVSWKELQDQRNGIVNTARFMKREANTRDQKQKKAKKRLRRF